MNFVNTLEQKVSWQDARRDTWCVTSVVELTLLCVTWTFLRDLDTKWRILHDGKEIWIWVASNFLHPFKILTKLWHLFWLDKFAGLGSIVSRNVSSRCIEWMNVTSSSGIVAPFFRFLFYSILIKCKFHCSWKELIQERDLIKTIKKNDVNNSNELQQVYKLQWYCVTKICVSIFI